MPPDPTQWRLDLAAEIAIRLRRFPGIRAMVVAGSVARGWSDAYSDLELPLVWDTLPTDDTRLRIAEELGATFLYPYNGPAHEDNLLLQSFQIDFWHSTVTAEEQVIQRVLTAFSTDLSDSNFMDTLRACIPLTGENLIQAWKVRAREYPPQLALRNIQLQLDEIQASHLAVLAYRDNPTHLYAQISSLQELVFQILLALNGQYFPTFKWIYPTLANLAVKPLACEERFRQAYLASPADAAVDTIRLVTETLRLVQKTFPQLDIDPALARLKLTRAVHSKPVHL